MTIEMAYDAFKALQEQLDASSDDMYEWLSDRLGINVPDCTFESFSDTMLEEAYTVCKEQLLEGS